MPEDETWLIRENGEPFISRRDLPERAWNNGYTWTGWLGGTAIQRSRDSEVTLIHRLAPVVEPRTLTTEQEFRDAPMGTIAAEDGHRAWQKALDGSWLRIGERQPYTNREAATFPRTVLRWGWGEGHE